MNEISQDRADVMVFPPILATTILLSAVLQWSMPFGPLAGFDQLWRFIVGGVVMLCGIALSATGRRSMVRRGTNVSPLQPTLTLVTDGVFRWTRNPLYVGGCIAMAGLAIAVALDWLFVLFVPSVLILHIGVVQREERYLERKFTDQYRGYKARVPRYLWSF